MEVFLLLNLLAPALPGDFYGPLLEVELTLLKEGLALGPGFSIFGHLKSDSVSAGFTLLVV